MEHTERQAPTDTSATERDTAIADAEQVIIDREREHAALASARDLAHAAEQTASAAYDRAATLARTATETHTSAQSAATRAEQAWSETPTTGAWSKVEAARLASEQASLRESAAKVTMDTAQADHARARARLIEADADLRASARKVGRARDVLAGLKTSRRAMEERDAERIGAQEREAREAEELRAGLIQLGREKVPPLLVDVFHAAELMRRANERLGELLPGLRGALMDVGERGLNTTAPFFVLNALTMYRRMRRAGRAADDPLAMIMAPRNVAPGHEDDWLRLAWEMYERDPSVASQPDAAPPDAPQPQPDAHA